MWRFDAISPLLTMISALRIDALAESEREPQNLPRWLMRSRLMVCQELRQSSRPQLITEPFLCCAAKNSREWSLIQIQKKKVQRSPSREHSMGARKRNGHLPQSMNSSKDHMRHCENTL